jgi:hypothetical protein
MLNYSGARPASLFGQLWILAADYLEALKSPGPIRYRAPADMSRSERYLNAAVLEDLSLNRPKLLVVLRSARDLPANGYRRLNYIAYFRRDARIARILDQYQWIGDIGDYSVYERGAEGGIAAIPPSAAPGTQDVIGADTQDLHLRFKDPTFLFAALTFFVVFGAVIRRDRATGAP